MALTKADKEMILNALREFKTMQDEHNERTYALKSEAGADVSEDLAELKSQVTDLAANVEAQETTTNEHTDDINTLRQQVEQLGNSSALDEETITSADIADLFSA